LISAISTLTTKSSKGLVRICKGNIIKKWTPSIRRKITSIW
jgi:hypothetical protein